MRKIIFNLAALILFAYSCNGVTYNRYTALSLSIGKSHLPSFLLLNLENGWPAKKLSGNFILELTNNLMIQIETSYSVAKGSFVDYRSEEEVFNQKINYKQISFFEPSVLVNCVKSKKFILYSGIGFGYHKYKMNSDINNYEISIIDKYKTKFTAFTLNFILGIDFFPLTSHIWLTSQIKYRLGSSKYHYDNKDSVTDEIPISLKSNEITIGMKYFF